MWASDSHFSPFSPFSHLLSHWDALVVLLSCVTSPWSMMGAFFLTLFALLSLTSFLLSSMCYVRSGCVCLAHVWGWPPPLEGEWVEVC